MPPFAPIRAVIPLILPCHKKDHFDLPLSVYRYLSFFLYFRVILTNLILETGLIQVILTASLERSRNA